MKHSPGDDRTSVGIHWAGVPVVGNSWVRKIYAPSQTATSSELGARFLRAKTGFERATLTPEREHFAEVGAGQAEDAHQHATKPTTMTAGQLARQPALRLGWGKKSLPGVARCQSDCPRFPHSLRHAHALLEYRNHRYLADAVLDTPTPGKRCSSR
jgi:hypothetical protein